VNEDKSYTKMDANLRVRSPYEQVEIELLVHKLSKEFIVKCSACHNDYANGIIGPSLLDKDAEFIAGTIAKYKSGQKENVLMQALVKQMSDEAIQKLAEEIATFNQEIVKLREAKQ
jgi:cytochrome c553